MKAEDSSCTREPTAQDKLKGWLQSWAPPYLQERLPGRRYMAQVWLLETCLLRDVGHSSSEAEPGEAALEESPFWYHCLLLGLLW